MGFKPNEKATVDSVASVNDIDRATDDPVSVNTTNNNAETDSAADLEITPEMVAKVNASALEEIKKALVDIPVVNHDIIIAITNTMKAVINADDALGAPQGTPKAKIEELRNLSLNAVDLAAAKIIAENTASAEEEPSESLEDTIADINSQAMDAVEQAIKDAEAAASAGTTVNNVVVPATGGNSGGSSSSSDSDWGLLEWSLLAAGLAATAYVGFKVYEGYTDTDTIVLDSSSDSIGF